MRKFVPQLSKENLTANQPLLDMLAAIAQKHKATPAQISMAWMLHKYPNVVPIPGSKKLEHIMENLKAADVTLTAQEFKEMEDALNTCQIYGHRGHVESEQHTFSRNWLHEEKA